MVSTPVSTGHPPLLRWLPWLLLAVLWALATTLGLFAVPTATAPAAAARPALPQMPPAEVDQHLSAETAVLWFANRREGASAPATRETPPEQVVAAPAAIPPAAPPATSISTPTTSEVLANPGPTAKTPPLPSRPTSTSAPATIASPTTTATPPSSPTPGANPAAPPAPAPAEAAPNATPPAVPAAPPAAPRDAGQALAAASAHLNAGRWAEAEEAFSAVLALPGARTAAAWFGRARARDGLGRTNDALADLDAALAVDARHPYALLLAGDIHKRRGDAAQAATWYRRYLEAWPQGRRAAELQAWLKRP